MKDIKKEMIEKSAEDCEPHMTKATCFRPL